MSKMIPWRFEHMHIFSLLLYDGISKAYCWRWNVIKVHNSAKLRHITFIFCFSGLGRLFDSVNITYQRALDQSQPGVWDLSTSLVIWKQIGWEANVTPASLCRYHPADTITAHRWAQSCHRTQRRISRAMLGSVMLTDTSFRFRSYRGGHFHDWVAKTRI